MAEPLALGAKQPLTVGRVRETIWIDVFSRSIETGNLLGGGSASNSWLYENGLSMARVHFTLETKLTPGAVLAVLTDFGTRRAQVWPNIDDRHFQVHDQGPGRAEVTEGSSVAGGVWEREQYTWDATAGTVAVETIDSNTWGPGSRWDYKLAPSAGGGTVIDVTAERHGKGWKGRLIELGLAAIGARMLRSQMEQALARSAS